MNIDLSNIKGAMLVAFFNILSPQATVKKFSDRESALRRIATTLATREAFTPEELDQFQRAGLMDMIHQGGASVVASPAADTGNPPEEGVATQTEPEPIAPEQVSNKLEVVPAPLPVVSSNGLAMLKSVVERTEPGKPSDVLLGDVELDLNPTVRKRAKRILDELLADGMLIMQKLVDDDDQEVIVLTQLGVSVCVAHGFVQASAYAPTPASDKKAPKASKAPKAPKEPKAPKAPAAPRDPSFAYHPNPKVTPHAVREGSKVARIIDLISRPQGATFDELQAMMAPKSTVRGVLQYDVNALVGYGVSYDGKIIRIILPKGMSAPLPHRAKSEKPAPAARKTAAPASK